MPRADRKREFGITNLIHMYVRETSPGKFHVYYRYKKSDMTWSTPRPNDIVLYKDPRIGPRQYKWPDFVLNWKRNKELELFSKKYGVLKGTEKIPSLQSLMDDFLALKATRHSPKTVKTYKDACNRLISFAGDLPVTEITEELLVKFRDHYLGKKYSPTSVSLWLRTLRALLNYAKRKKFIEDNPVIGDILPVIDATVPVAFSMEELKAIFEWCDKNYPGASDQMRFLVYSACRADESASIEWSRFDEPRARLQYHNMKSNRWEWLQLDPEFLSFMKSLPHHYGRFVFRYRSGMTLSHIMNKAIKALGLSPELHLHRLKSNAAERFCMMDLDVFEVMRAMHHESMLTTQKYYRSFNSDRLAGKSKQERLEEIHAALRRPPERESESALVTIARQVA